MLTPSALTVRRLLLLIAILAGILSLWDRLTLDLWNDELYTLEYFVFVPFETVVTDYHVPNNHVLFSLALKAWAWLVRVDDLSDALAHPERLRILSLIFSLATISGLMQVARTWQKSNALLPAVMLIFSVPFLNFALQLRGYALSLALTSWLIALIIRQPRWWSFGAITCLAAGLAYTVPSNYYVLLGMGLGTLAASILLRSEANEWYLKLAALVAGVGVSFLCYLPILEDVFVNEYVSASADHNHFIEKLWNTLPLMMGMRLLTWAVALYALIVSLIRKRWSRADGANFAFLIATMATPYLLSYLRQDQAPYRAFLVVLPPLLLVISYGLHRFLTDQPVRKLVGALFLVLIVMEGFFNVRFFQERNRQEMLFNIRHDGRAQNLVSAFYLADYEPRASVGNFVAEHPDETVLIHHCEPHGIRHFLREAGVPTAPVSLIDSILEVRVLDHMAGKNPDQPPSVFVVSSNPYVFRSDYLRVHPTHRVEFLFEPGKEKYHNFLRVIADDSALLALGLPVLRHPDLPRLMISNVPSDAVKMVNGRTRWTMCSAVDSGSLDVMNDFISAVDDSAYILHYGLQWAFLPSVQSDAFVLVEVAHESPAGKLELVMRKAPNIVYEELGPPAEMSVDAPYGPSLQRTITELDPGRLMVITAREAASGAAEVDLVMELRHAGVDTAYYWKSIPVKMQQESTTLYVRIPRDARAGDQLALFHWHRSGEPVWVKDFGIRFLTP